MAEKQLPNITIKTGLFEDPSIGIPLSCISRCSVTIISSIVLCIISTQGCQKNQPKAPCQSSYLTQMIMLYVPSLYAQHSCGMLFFSPISCYNDIHSYFLITNYCFIYIIIYKFLTFCYSCCDGEENLATLCEKLKSVRIHHMLKIAVQICVAKNLFGIFLMGLNLMDFSEDADWNRQDVYGDVLMISSYSTLSAVYAFFAVILIVKEYLNPDPKRFFFVVTAAVLYMCIESLAPAVLECLGVGAIEPDTAEWVVVFGKKTLNWHNFLLCVESTVLILMIRVVFPFPAEEDLQTNEVNMPNVMTVPAVPPTSLTS